MTQLKCSRWTMLPTSSLVRSYWLSFSGAFMAPSLRLVLVGHPVRRALGRGLWSLFPGALESLLALVGGLEGLLHRGGVARREGVLHPHVDHLIGRRVGAQLDVVHRIAGVGRGAGRSRSRFACGFH